MTQQYEDVTLPDHLEPDERDPEAPAVDALEQSVLADPADPAAAAEASPGLEVNDWDAREQATVVALEDEYDR